MFTVSFYRPIDLCFLFVLLDILCRAFEWIGMIWYKLIHRFAKLEEQQFSNTSRLAKQKRQNQTKDDKSTFFSRCSFQMFFPDKGPSDMKNQSRHVVSVVCATSICSFWWRCVVSPFAAVFSCLQKCSFLIYIYIYIACIYFGFWFSIFGLTSTKRVFEHVSQRIKGAFKSQGPDFTTENMRNTSKRLMSDGTSTWEFSSLFLLGPTPNMSTLLKSMYNIYIIKYIYIYYG